MKRMMTAGVILLAGIQTTLSAQSSDSVVVNVGKASKMTLVVKDKDDLATLKKYNFQSLMDDMVHKLEAGDSTPLTKSSADYLKDTTSTVAEPVVRSYERERDRDRDEDRRWRERRWTRRTYHSFNIDLGMNNYLENGKFTDANNSLYTVKPWGSWYVGLNSVLRTRVVGKFFVEWGGGVSWYNFKFANEKVTMSKDDNGVIFAEDTRALNFEKSKLTAAYINLSMVPMIDFAGYGKKPMVFDGDRLNFDHRGSFRIGAGPYVGYLVDSYTKVMYKQDSDKSREHNHDNFYLSNMRYGLRLQIGFRDTDIFFNYDMNELFTEGKGPKLNAFSFGITL